MTTDAFSVYFWGVRGSHPSPGEQFVQTGGNTSCVEMRVGNQRIIFDAGTGLVHLGQHIVAEDDQRPLLIMLSHYHHDHIQGLPHFIPLFRSKQLLYIVAPWNMYQDRVWDLLLHASSRSMLTEQPRLQARRRTFVIEGGERLWWNAEADVPLQITADPALEPPEGFIQISTYRSMGHPRGGSMCYRVDYAGKSAVFATDIELYVGSDQNLAAFAQGADLIVHDAHFTPEEYSHPVTCKQGWGHSTWEMAVELAQTAEIKQVALFHHDPSHTDTLLNSVEAEAQAAFPGAFMAREGMHIWLSESPSGVSTAATAATDQADPVGDSDT